MTLLGTSIKNNHVLLLTSFYLNQTKRCKDLFTKSWIAFRKAMSILTMLTWWLGVASSALRAHLLFIRSQMLDLRLYCHFSPLWPTYQCISQYVHTIRERTHFCPKNTPKYCNSLHCSFGTLFANIIFISLILHPGFWHLTSTKFWILGPFLWQIN